MKRKNITGLIAIVAIAAVAIFAGCIEEEKTAIPTYKIAEQKDVSYLNVVRLDIRVVVPSDITEQGVKDVAGDVVKKITKSQDVNAIGILMYDKIEDVNGIYTVASVDWAPYGDWARADEVETGDYSKHQFSYKIREDNSEKPTKRELEIYDAYYKAVFAEPDVPEAVIKERVAKEYGISTEELDKIWRKVWAYKNRE